MVISAGLNFQLQDHSLEQTLGNQKHDDSHFAPNSNGAKTLKP
jgi:hypothetical protein